MLCLKDLACPGLNPEKAAKNNWNTCSSCHCSCSPGTVATHCHNGPRAMQTMMKFVYCLQG